MPLSSESEDIRNYVGSPLNARTPIGYRREFLDAYKPNKTSYLNDSIKKHLLQIGKPSHLDHPAGTYARQIYDRLLVDLSWASSRLEGNTYNRLDTERLIHFGQAAEGKDAQEAQMILNHKAAIEFLITQAEEIDINRYTLLNLHALLSENLLTNPQACGRLRHIPVQISGTVYHPLSIPQMIEECFLQLLDTAKVIKDPFEQAFFLMVHLPHLQPFEDVNKRVSRLSANIPLIRLNLCPLSFLDVPEQAYIEGILGVYELNKIELLRDVFVWAYERSCQNYIAVRQSMAEPDPFRMRYREALIQTIHTIIVNKESPTKKLIQTLAEKLIPQADFKKFVEMVLTEFSRIHEGNIARYRIRPNQFYEWEKKQQKMPLR